MLSGQYMTCLIHNMNKHDTFVLCLIYTKVHFAYTRPTSLPTFVHWGEFFFGFLNTLKCCFIVPCNIYRHYPHMHAVAQVQKGVQHIHFRLWSFVAICLFQYEWQRHFGLVKSLKVSKGRVTIACLDVPPPSNSGKWRFRSGSPNLKM